MWGFDFLKYDLCSYDGLLKGSHRPEDLRKPYAVMGSILKALDRDMVFNLCEYGLATFGSGAATWAAITGEPLTTWAAELMAPCGRVWTLMDSVKRVREMGGSRRLERSR
jgi:hypothetical protein